ncbi:exopolygalacturonase-like [Humulus lupulus]|uniref:exopolygalacturonase-like n=1 Tax=Humulus lupulus TaxID=3486 RepID=UPI002B4176E8|nr:exopolygalacturonase-like [Humulus lupulus]
MASRLPGHFAFLILLFVVITKVQSDQKVFNVINFGVIADGKTDNSKAFVDVWNQACSYSGRGVVLIPKGTYYASSMVFSGPCKGQTLFSINGNLKAPTDKKAWAGTESWISFRNIINLEISGGGSFDGQGPSAWPYNDCKTNPHCVQLPISIGLDFVNDSRIHDIKLINSKNFNMKVFGCLRTTIEHIQITAPVTSPNTDGIHIGSSTCIKIFDSLIATGDDCVSISPGTENLQVSGVTCGPGHGISIGSLGKYANEGDVKNLVIQNCNLTGTDNDNGVRIKTWAPSPPSIVYNVTFENISMKDVDNPIIIDQQYCPFGNCVTQVPTRPLVS